MKCFKDGEVFVESASSEGLPASRALAGLIRESLGDLEAAAEEAEEGRLGGAKLGVLVAVTKIVKALRAIDVEFTRHYGIDLHPQPDDESITLPYIPSDDSGRRSS
jgi:hypothetical protein